MTRGRVQYVGLVTATTGRCQDDVLCDIVCAATAEHEGVHTHSHMASFRLDTLPNKHTCAVHAVHRTRLRADLVACNIENTTVQNRRLSNQEELTDSHTEEVHNI